jgi:glycosyltransferase involved in cell wall biosynthesis
VAVDVLSISVVVPAFNEERLIRHTLERVKAAMGVFTGRGWTTELVVCDNNSTDRTAELARAAGARVVFEPINQIGRARNTGAAAATGNWLLFIDADSHPSPALLGAVADTIAEGRCLAGGSTVKMDQHHPLASLVVHLWNAISRAGRLLAGSFIFCEAAAFRHVGGFSQDLFAGEELELSRRLKLLARETGKRIVILHRHPLITSARKIHLYTPWEHVRFVVKALLRSRKTLGDRKACHTWYDGRR